MATVAIARRRIGHDREVETRGRVARGRGDRLLQVLDPHFDGARLLRRAPRREVQPARLGERRYVLWIEGEHPLIGVERRHDLAALHFVLTLGEESCDELGPRKGDRPVPGVPRLTRRRRREQDVPEDDRETDERHDEPTGAADPSANRDRFVTLLLAQFLTGLLEGHVLSLHDRVELRIGEFAGRVLLRRVGDRRLTKRYLVAQRGDVAVHRRLASRTPATANAATTSIGTNHKSEPSPDVGGLSRIDVP